MAALIADDRRDLFHGLMLLDAGLPNRIGRMDASPVNPMLVFVGSTAGFESKTEFTDLVKLLNKSKLPFTHQRLESQTPATWISGLVLWADAVNRM